MANPVSGLRVITDVEAQARRAGHLNFGSGGPASIDHICGELMKKDVGINLIHAPYRGGAPITTDLI